MPLLSPLIRVLVGLSLVLPAVVGWGAEAKLPIAETPADPKYLERWTPSGNTNAHDLPYPQVTEPYQKENDAIWRDDRWQRTLKGPIVAHSILLPGHEVGPKVAAVDAGAGKQLLYDLEAGSFVAAVVEGALQIDGSRFGMLNRPSLLGDAAFVIPAERLWRAGAADQAVERQAIDYQGHYLHDNRVVLATQIAGVDLLESAPPTDDPALVVREFELTHTTPPCG